jgi:hypothetical protein
MSLVEDMFKGGNIVTGLAIGLGVVVVGPVVLPVLRPIAKSVIKAGLIAYDQGRVALTELNERTGDLVGEARSEMARLGGESEVAEAAETPASQRARKGARAEGPAQA